MTRDEFQKYWLEQHAPLVLSARKKLGFCRYVQTHTIDDPRSEERRIIFGRPLPFDVIEEYWWSHIEEFPFNQENREPGNLAKLWENENKFVDQHRSPFMLAEEHVIFEKITEADINGQPESRVKLVYCGRRRPELSRKEYSDYWLNVHGQIIKMYPKLMLRYVQNHVIHEDINENLRAGHNRPEPFDGITEIWYNSAADRNTQDPSTVNINPLNKPIALDEAKFIIHSESPCFLTREYVVWA